MISMIMFADLENNLPKKIIRTRKRPNVSGIDYEYVKKIKGKMNGRVCVMEGKSKTGQKKVTTAIGNLTESITFGYTRARFKKNAPIVAKIGNKKYPKVFASLRSLSQQLFPTFGWDCVSINHNQECKPHKDKNNQGESIIVGFGNYTGGKLNIEGKSYDIRYKPVKFDGKQLTHYVEPFEGDRWTAVYYKSTNYQRVEDSLKILNNNETDIIDGVKSIKK
jgi:hypothetical protein